MQKLKFINPDLHGVLDYLAAIALIFAPILLALDQDSLLVYWFSIAAGIGLVIYSLGTDYKLSVMGLFSFKQHLILDLTASAAFIALAFLHQGTPLSMGYALVMGAGVIFVVLFSNNGSNTTN